MHPTIDYTDITKADIQAKLDKKGVKYTTKDNKDDLIAKLEGQVEDTDVATVKMVEDTVGGYKLARNVKYKGIFYNIGDSVELDTIDVKYFKEKQLIK